MMDSLITDEARALIGKETRTELGEISLSDIQRYAIAVDDLNPLYFDKEQASLSVHKGIIAPPNMLTALIGWESGPREADLNPDGTGARGGGPRIPLRGVNRAMGAGQELEFLVPVRPGDRFIRVSKIANISEREGRSGRFVVTEQEQQYINQKGEVAVVCRSSTITR